MTDSESRDPGELEPGEASDALQGFYEAFKFEPGGNENLSGTVTQLMHEAYGGDEGAHHVRIAYEKFWKKVFPTLAVKAKNVVVRFPSIFKEPKEMVSDIFERLDAYLHEHIPENRNHFYALAVRMFHRYLLDSMRPLRNRDVSLDDADIPEPIDPAMGPADLAEAAEEVQLATMEIDNLPENERDTFLLHTMLGLTFRSIGESQGVSAAESHRRFKKAETTLTRRLTKSDDA